MTFLWPVRFNAFHILGYYLNVFVEDVFCSLDVFFGGIAMSLSPFIHLLIILLVISRGHVVHPLLVV